MPPPPRARSPDGKVQEYVGDQPGSPDGEQGAGDEEGVLSAEYSRWLHLESNWEIAEDKRHQYMEGSQLRKSRNERHRERGQDRQQMAHEQMKAAKQMVENVAKKNMAQGNQVRNDVQDWLAEKRTREMNTKEHCKEMRQKTKTERRVEAEREALLALKKEISLQVRLEVVELAKASKDLQNTVLESNRSMASKIKAETSEEVIDGAKQFMFDKRRQTALTTAAQIKDWAAERRVNQQKVRDNTAKSREKAQLTAPLGAPRRWLRERKFKLAEEHRERKRQIKEANLARKESDMAYVKQLANSVIQAKFADTTNSRRMLQHPHYQEVSAVVTDVTSSISKEIAAQPRRKIPTRYIEQSTAKAALRMSPGKAPAS